MHAVILRPLEVTIVETCHTASFIADFSFNIIIYIAIAISGITAHLMQWYADGVYESITRFHNSW